MEPFGFGMVPVDPVLPNIVDTLGLWNVPGLHLMGHGSFPRPQIEPFGCGMLASMVYGVQKIMLWLSKSPITCTYRVRLN
jgi:hypothetical protein